ncbi:hypothetical protein [Nonomuraea sp. JJY05]|uniref:hypothetical protein n=1 Tax=Nonomuraea sp. JJY05 TaxID=3350255 RepID=UPI00373F203D
MMSTNPDWDDLVRADQDYQEARERVFAGDPVPALRESLALSIPTPPGRETALRVLDEYGRARPNVVRALVPELFELALGQDWRSERVRVVLSRLDAAVLERELKPIIKAFVRETERDAADYWGAIALLVKAGLRPLLDRVLRAAQASDDEDTRVVAQHWMAGSAG